MIFSQYEEKENRTKEKRCFTIEYIEITNAEVIPHWVNLALFKSEFIGQCLGTLVQYLANRVIVFYAQAYWYIVRRIYLRIHSLLVIYFMFLLNVT